MTVRLRGFGGAEKQHIRRCIKKNSHNYISIQRSNEVGELIPSHAGHNGNDTQPELFMATA